MTTTALVAAVFVRDASYQYLATVRSLLAADGVQQVLVGSPDESLLEPLQVDSRVQTVYSASAVALVNLASERWNAAVAACDEPVLVAGDAFHPALAAMAADLRVVVVCAWSNCGGYLSFPRRNVAGSHQIENLDEHLITQRLRELGPAPRMVPISLARGPLTVISRTGITAAGGLVENPFASLDVAVAEFGQRAARRGLLTVLDATTFVMRPFDLGLHDPDVFDRTDVRSWLTARHPFYEALYRQEQADAESALGIAHSLATAKVLGLTVLIDGSCLGPLEMGTQVNLVNLVRALADRNDVREVVVSMPGAVPSYAVTAFGNRKIRSVHSALGEFPAGIHGHIVHRPFQPDSPMPLHNWRRAAPRLCVTLQDLIAYRNGSYHPDGTHWLRYRHHLAVAAAQADGVLTISRDVAETVRDEQLRVDADRLWPIPLGTDHLTGDEPMRPPTIALQHGFAAREFLFVLGTNYSHKNRDLAVHAWNELRGRGHDIGLVLVGAAVPYGSSRHYEALAHATDEQAILLADVTSEERNWLLRHAVAVVYPTSAEGFGFVPFEAARFGTPTVAVSFGPLSEVGAQPEVAAESWSPADIADAIEQLVVSPERRAAAVRQTLAAGTEFTWEATAASLVDAYRATLGSSARM